WFSQANYIFSRLGIRSNLGDCVFIEDILFKIELKRDYMIGKRKIPPEAYLFICPTHNFRVGPMAFKMPECPAYWSFDPSGIERLTAEQAFELGFPTLCFATQVHWRSYDDSVYAGLREFHQAKGFDPDSQDVARHLGHTLYQLSSAAEGP
ncbi:hypothetical protein R3P38DRAFT_2444085, partial [Favolaschia claudopus]